MVPRLLLLAAAVRTLLLAPVGSFQRNGPILGLPPELLAAANVPPAVSGAIEGPVLAVAALAVAALLRAVGHTMALWFYAVAAFATIAAAAVLSRV
jgi:hypothetical protein